MSIKGHCSLNTLNKEIIDERPLNKFKVLYDQNIFKNINQCSITRYGTLQEFSTYFLTKDTRFNLILGIHRIIYYSENYKFNVKGNLIRIGKV